MVRAGTGADTVGVAASDGAARRAGMAGTGARMARRFDMSAAKFGASGTKSGSTADQPIPMSWSFASSRVQRAATRPPVRIEHPKDGGQPQPRVVIARQSEPKPG